ncbi:cyclin-like protein [Calocera viscosa TUFC12733]|uniref:B-related factor 1 n=1 Tax=Calocera viscosa (strain TUFC12733) TaxID=1330018 RepID=A0A167KH95_CALVF|nr:cyclin-like protein [Calocera viscosa TUFC12733]
MPRRCPECGGAKFDFDASAGASFCVECGCVTEENTIVAEVTFGETSGGAAIVQGSHVAAGATRAKINAPWGKQGNVESMEQAKHKARQILQGLKRHLGITETVIGYAERWWILAYEGGFTKGRKSLLVIGACCYVAVRQNKKPIMLIDLSDLLQVNVFELGTVYLQLVQQLNIRNIELIDPEFYIERFSKLLEFGDDREKIRDEAVRIVHRFKQDWLHTGRRPSGICGAALLLAARMNNYRRSVLEIVQVVKIADTTLKKRLEEFGKTPSANFSLEEFRHQWLDVEQNPPSFTKGQEKEEKAKMLKLTGKENRKLGKKRKRTVEDDGESIAGSSVIGSPAPSSPAAKRLRLANGEPEPTSQSPTPGPIMGEQSFKNIVDEMAREGLEPDAEAEEETADVLAGEPLFLPEEPTQVQRGGSGIPSVATMEATDKLIDELISMEVTLPLTTDREDTVIAESLALADQVDEKRLQIMRASPSALEGDDDIEIDDAELDIYILTEQEVQLKERVWVELNRQYLEECAAKEALAQGEPDPAPKKRKTSGKRIGPRDSTTARGATPAESALALINGRSGRKKGAKQEIRSKRINYEALEKLFERSPKLGRLSPTQDKASLRSPTLEKGGAVAGEDEEEEEEMEVVEEDGPIPAYRALQGLQGREQYDESYEEVYDESGWQEEV